MIGSKHRVMLATLMTMILTGALMLFAEVAAAATDECCPGTTGCPICVASIKP